jgi:acetyl esterase
MPLRTAIFTVVLDRFGRSSILDLDESEIATARQWAAPARWPHTWVTGGVSGRVSIREAEFTARDGVERALRIYAPLYSPGPLPIVAFFHGGGYVLGNTRMYDPLCAFLAKSVPAVVVSVDYRQAPEHRAPKAVEDSIDGLRWAYENAAAFRGDPTRIAVCGDSAGGGLAALVCHAAYDEGGPAIAHQSLLYPSTDATQSFPSAAEHGGAPVLKRREDPRVHRPLPRRLRGPRRPGRLGLLAQGPARYAARAHPDRRPRHPCATRAWRMPSGSPMPASRCGPPTICAPSTVS